LICHADIITGAVAPVKYKNFVLQLTVSVNSL